MLRNGVEEKNGDFVWKKNGVFFFFFGLVGT